MAIAEYIKPGAYIHHRGSLVPTDVSILLESLETKVAEANRALELFLRAKETVVREGTKEDLQEAFLARQSMYDLTPAEALDAAKKQRLAEARIDRKREVWSSGEMPGSYSYTLPNEYARSFMYAVDMYGRILATLRNCLAKARDAYLEGVDEEDECSVHLQELHDGIDATVQSFQVLFPDVREMRNSDAHIDERMLLRAFANAPQHSLVRVFGSLCYDTDTFMMTMRDGQQGRLQVADKSMRSLVGHLMNVFAVFEWRMPPQHCPDPTPMDELSSRYD